VPVWRISQSFALFWRRGLAGDSEHLVAAVVVVVLEETGDPFGILPGGSGG